MECRICLEGGGNLVQPCNCKGTAASVHAECLERWINVSGKEQCEICNYAYETEDAKEWKCKLCPPWHLADPHDTSLDYILFSIGFLVFFLFCSYSLITWGVGEESFAAVNGFQVCLLLVFSKVIRILPTYCAWKVWSSCSFVMAGGLRGEWEYTIIECGVTCALLVITYAVLVCKHSKQEVRYIYMDDEPTNEPIGEIL
jgi:hypothetical protein